VLGRLEPRLVPAAVDVARRTVGTLRRNLFFALAFNVMGVPVAVMGHAGPELAAAALGASVATIAAGSFWLLAWRRHT